MILDKKENTFLHLDAGEGYCDSGTMTAQPKHLQTSSIARHLGPVDLMFAP